MQRLILLRHAKAERSAPSGEDFDRPLAERGRDDARLMGRVLADAGFAPAYALVSSARRTTETWAAAAEVFPGAEARFDKRIYLAASRTLRDLVEQEEGRDGTVMLVGHNPGIHQLVIDLLIEGAAPPSTQAQAARKFPTASAAVFEMDVAGRPVFEGLYFAADHGGGAGE